MPRSRTASTIPEDRRRGIFRALVAAQDQRVPVAKSRVQVAAEFGVTRRQVELIEEEGLDKEWPPLSEEAVAPAPPAQPEVCQPADGSGNVEAAIPADPVEPPEAASESRAA